MNNLIKGKILSSCCNTQDYCFFFVGLMYNYNRLSWVFLHDLSAGCTLVKHSMVCVVCLSFLRHRHNMILLSFSASPINKLCFSPYVSIIFFSFSFTLWFFEVELARLPLTLSFLSVHSPPSTPIQNPPHANLTTAYCLCECSYCGLPRPDEAEAPFLLVSLPLNADTCWLLIMHIFLRC